MGICPFVVRSVGCGGALESEMKWQPIETAPKDGTWILVTEETGTWMEVVRWYEDEWCSYPVTIFGFKDEPPASHWMPLPDPPA